MKHTAIYMRVSTKAQDTASQEADLARWQAVHNDFQCVVYSDKATGKTMDRPGWNKLWEQVQEGNVERIVVWRLDRLGRTASGLTRLFDDLVLFKIGLVSMREGLDLETPAGRLMANVLASVAAYETEVRRERVLAGIAAARERGVKIGGWKRGKYRTIKPRKTRQIRDLHQQGMSMRGIAKMVEMAPSSVRYAIKNEIWKRHEPKTPKPPKPSVSREAKQASRLGEKIAAVLRENFGTE